MRSNSRASSGAVVATALIAVLLLGASPAGPRSSAAEPAGGILDESIAGAEREAGGAALAFIPEMGLVRCGSTTRPLSGMLTPETPEWTLHLNVTKDRPLLGVALARDPAAGAASPLTCDVEFRREGREPARLTRMQLAWNAGGWVSQRVDLSRWAGTAGDLVLTARPSSPGGFRVAVSVAGPYARGGGSRPNVLLICLDTLRADHLGSYGYWRPTSPFLDGLAAKGTRFAACNSQAPWTSPSLFSVFTGQYPSCNWSGTRSGAATFNRHATTLARVLSENGYLTAAFTGGAATVPRRGLAQGFGSYRTLADWGKAPAAYAAVTPWLEEHRDERFFLLFHTYEIHAPYRRRLFSGPDAERRATAIRNYDSGILFADGYVRKLYERLGSLGLLDHTLIVVFADHGEDFRTVYSSESGPTGEHGYTLHQSLLHVPLVFVGPSVPAGNVVADRVQLFSLGATVLDLVGVPAPDCFQARSLAPLVRGGPPAEGAGWSYSEGPDWGPDRKAFVEGRWKLIYVPETETGSPEGRETGTSEWFGMAPVRLFDLEQDPLETADIHSAQPQVAARLLARAREVMGENRRTLESNRQSFTEPLVPDDDLLRQLRALGY